MNDQPVDTIRNLAETVPETPQPLPSPENPCSRTPSSTRIWQTHKLAITKYLTNPPLSLNTLTYLIKCSHLPTLPPIYFSTLSANNKRKYFSLLLLFFSSHGMVGSIYLEALLAKSNPANRFPVKLLFFPFLSVS